jgi:hypothetical protein
VENDMNTFKSTLRIALLGALMTAAGATMAAASKEQAAHLGADLTPFGAEKAGNADGSIPAWTGGNTKPIAGFTNGGKRPDPLASTPICCQKA